MSKKKSKFGHQKLQDMVFDVQSSTLKDCSDNMDGIHLILPDEIDDCNKG